jgi:hypothetical protein
MITDADEYRVINNIISEFRFLRFEEIEIVDGLGFRDIYYKYYIYILYEYILYEGYT